MNNEEYQKYLQRLREIEDCVKDPSTGLHKIEALIEETKTIAEKCHAFTRGLQEKVDSLLG